MTNWCYKIVFCIFVCGLIAFIVINVRQQYVRMHEHHRLVRTTTGPIRGERLYTLFEMHAYYSFKGIPYAQPPIGELRFLPPLPVKPWYETLECHDHGQICLQHNTNGTEILGSEDCLYLNVYTPDCMPPVLKTVMIYLHGGAWYHGSGNTDLQGPDFLIEENVIVVTINYRLGFLGFLSLGTRKYSGNQGLKDQQLALQWVQDNIYAFGGDRTRITLIGFSAGSLSCQFHTFSPRSQKLFQRSIQMSFTFDIFSIVTPIGGTIVDKMYQFAHLMNNTATNLNELITFLQSIDVVEILKKYPFERFNTIAMPTLESIDAEWPMFQGSAEELMYETNFSTSIDVMTGFTSAEAIQFGTESLFQNFLTNFKTEIPSLKFNRNQYNTTVYYEASEKILTFYFNGTLDKTETTFRNYIRLKSDVYHRYHIDRNVKQLAQKSTGNIFYYQFGAETRLNYYKQLHKSIYEWGSSHGDDLCYIFRCMKLNDVYVNPTAQEYRLIKTMAGLYASFAKYGHINWTATKFSEGVLWRPVHGNEYPFLNITSNTVRMESDPFKEERQFWANLLQDYSFVISHGKPCFVSSGVKVFLIVWTVCHITINLIY